MFVWEFVAQNGYVRGKTPYRIISGKVGDYRPQAPPPARGLCVTEFGSVIPLSNSSMSVIRSSMILVCQNFPILPAVLPPGRPRSAQEYYCPASARGTTIAFWWIVGELSRRFPVTYSLLLIWFCEEVAMSGKTWSDPISDQLNRLAWNTSSLRTGDWWKGQGRGGRCSEQAELHFHS